MSGYTTKRELEKNMKQGHLSELSCLFVLKSNSPYSCKMPLIFTFLLLSLQ